MREMYIHVGPELPLWKSILYCLLRFRFKDAYYIWNFNGNLEKFDVQNEDFLEVYYPDFDW